MSTDLPPPVTGDAEDLERVLGELPPLPEGMRWEMTLTAEAEVIRADGKVES